MTNAPLLFIFKSTCSSCRKVRSRLKEAGVSFTERDMSVNPLSAEELDALIGDRPHADFLNFRNETYRAKGYKANPPSREEAIREMANEPNLIRRPIFKRGAEIHIGGDIDTIPWLDLKNDAKFEG